MVCSTPQLEMSQVGNLYLHAILLPVWFVTQSSKA